MSVEDRIRHGLRANTEQLRPALEHAEEVVMLKVQRRRKARRVRYVGAGALVAAAVAVGAVWLPSALQGGTVTEEPGPAGSEGATPLPREGRIAPGTYVAQFNGGGPATPRAVLEVPSGFQAWGGSAVLEPGDSAGLGLYTATRVMGDPCDRGDLGEDPGPSAADLARALAAQERTRASSPTPVTIGGHDGLYLELTTPEPGAPGGCADDRYDLWRTGAGGPRFVGAGEVQRLWILDVAGHRVVVDVEQSGSEDVVRDVDAMVEAIRIVEQP
ncbi:hypothetical protein [Nocardioides caldifontis]|uniref:hypothetical protein n=1 Tax=Nocardioides caldifontis TaxID=2588938 RepID=UPI0011DF8C56|nr:hypothetical protein [Nocardioides caldifontis]